nr:hypothetical protein [Mycetocola zhujimingii]
MIEERGADLMKPRERELGLRFDSGRGFHTESRGSGHIAEMRQQCRLADSRVAAHHEGRAAAGVRLDQQLFDLAALQTPTQKFRQVRSVQRPTVSTTKPCGYHSIMADRGT